MKILSSGSTDSAGRYFALPVENIGVGIGLIYNGISYPFYDRDAAKYRLIRSPVIVLTHECDLDQSNDKVFNKDVLIAPITDVEALIDQIAKDRSEAFIKSYLAALARGKVSQIMYLPPWDEWQNGGVIFLNKISNTVLDVFNAPPAKMVCCLTGYGLDKLHEKMSNHLIREKADRLPLSWPPELHETTGKSTLIRKLSQLLRLCD